MVSAVLQARLGSGTHTTSTSVRLLAVDTTSVHAGKGFW